MPFLVSQIEPVPEYSVFSDDPLDFTIEYELD